MYLAFAVMAGITVVTGYGLATRLMPGRQGAFDLSEGYRLAGPIGYWNGLGAFAAIGIVLAVGVALNIRSRACRIVASVALIVLAPSLYFTYSRGSVLALGCGIGVMLAVSPRRLATLGSLAFLIPAPVAAVVIGSRLYGLTNQSTSLAQAIRDGRTMTLWLIGLGMLAAASVLLLASIEKRVSLKHSTRMIVGVAVVVAFVMGTAAALTAAGGPRAIFQRATDSFVLPPESSEGDLNDHLLNLSGSGRSDLWRVALSSYRDNPVTGVGAGAFERYWQRDEGAMFKARDAHSLYLETLTELGPFGLGVLLVAMAVVITSALAARKHPIVPAGVGAFAVYAVHAGVEWDWELTGLTLAALFAGSTGIIAMREPTMTRLRGSVRVGLGLVIAVVAMGVAAGWVGNRALEQGAEALARRDPGVALERAATADRWSPWSPYPLTVRGEALLRLGDSQAAQAAFTAAIDVDPGYWRAWLGLAVASSGIEREQSLDRASSLYRNSREIYETAVLLQKESNEGG